MYDNVDFKLKSSEAGGIDFLSETPCYFDVSGEHCFNGEQVVSGSLNGYRITVSQNGVNIKDHSLCKWFLGDNFQTMWRGDTQRAIEKLSDILHLPIDKATVTRIDFAQNFIVKHPTEVYFNHLGTSYPAKRLEQPDGLYYTTKNGLLIFYNKLKEQKAKGQPIPELYANRNTLRYEQRYKRGLSRTFKVERVTGAMLYNEAFYMGLVDQWKGSYKEIKKINDVSINFENMKGKKDFDLIGRLCLIEQRGGESSMIKEITEAYKKGELLRRQADELKRATHEACKLKEGFTTQSDVIKELDKKVDEACRFYR